MKHTTPITILLLALFFVSQLLGLFLITFDANQSVTVDKDNVTKVNVSYSETAMGERPEFERETGPLWYLVIGITIATLLLLLIMRLESGQRIWKAWYFLAVVVALSIALGVFINDMLALLIAIGLAAFKLFRNNPVLHNVTEVLMYAGIAFLLIPLFQAVWVSLVLLVVISLYDVYAVWKSKHMVKLAKFTTGSKVFAGLAIPYSRKGASVSHSQTPRKSERAAASDRAEKRQTADNPVKTKKTKNNQKSDVTKDEGTSAKGAKQAILGGGDIVFPLLFAGSILQVLLSKGMMKSPAFLLSLIVPVTTTIALALLFFKGKSDRFYPAMPYLTAGCLVGFGILQGILFLV